MRGDVNEIGKLVKPMHTANALLWSLNMWDQKNVVQDKYEDAIDFVNEDGDVYDIVNVDGNDA